MDKQEHQQEQSAKHAQTNELNIPSDKEAEFRLLGNLIEKPELLAEAIAKQLRPEDFYLTNHRRIFAAMLAVYSETKQMEFLSVRDQLLKEDQLDSIGGIAYLASLIDVQNMFFSVKCCIDKIKLTSLKRQTLHRSNLITNLLSDPGSDWTEIVRECNRTVEIISEQPTSEKTLTLQEVARQRLEHVEKVAQTGGRLIGIPTGYSCLDRLTLGLQPANLITLAARPGQGKSSLALNIAQYAASLGKSIGFFSLEMSAGELTDRLLCSIARVDLHLYRAGYLNREQWGQLGGALTSIEGYKITVNDNAKITPAELRVECLKIQKETGLDLVVLDYLQLMHPDTPKRERYQEIGQITHALKAISKELNIPILVLAQLNREVEKRADRKPILSDLREAGDIEQDSDMVWLLHFPPCDPETENLSPEVNLLIEKHRNGPTGKVKLVFLKEFTRFESAA